jgi:exoribonuclease R
MVLANETVAKKLATDFPDLSFLRYHPSRPKCDMEELQKSMEQMGISPDIKSARGLQESTWHYAGNDNVSQARMMVHNNKCANPMNVS